jgi:hypothetical protein
MLTASIVMAISVALLMVVSTANSHRRDDEGNNHL